MRTESDLANSGHFASPSSQPCMACTAATTFCFWREACSSGKQTQRHPKASLRDVGVEEWKSSTAWCLCSARRVGGPGPLVGGPFGLTEGEPLPDTSLGATAEQDQPTTTVGHRLWFGCARLRLRAANLGMGNAATADCTRGAGEDHNHHREHLWKRGGKRQREKGAT
jgi:hypothetical protein